ncbi:hypothetical protein QYF36_025990 [Acer negundo]|nr:hypothetical protein QYF36_025990 [Acer negundo]
MGKFRPNALILNSKLLFIMVLQHSFSNLSSSGFLQLSSSFADAIMTTAGGLECVERPANYWGGDQATGYCYFSARPLPPAVSSLLSSFAMLEIFSEV